MKQFIAPTYTFTPGASGVGTLDLSGIVDFNVKYLVAVINQTTGALVYSTGSAAYRYTSVVGTTLTLFADTTAMTGADTLQVIYEVHEQPRHNIFLDTSVDNVPASASAPLQIVSSTLGVIKEISWQDDIGEVFGIYVGSIGSEVLETMVGFGGDKVRVNIPQGSRVSIRNMKNATITSGNIAAKLIG